MRLPAVIAVALVAVSCQDIPGPEQSPLFSTHAAMSGQQSGMGILWGPQEFIRDKGKPTTETVVISSPDFDQFMEPFVLHVQNGNEYGSHRVSSATVWLDDQHVFGTADFSQTVSALSAEVQVTNGSELRVRLASKPGSVLSIWIEGMLKPAPQIFTYHISDHEPSMNTYACWSSDKRASTHHVPLGEGRGGYYTHNSSPLGCGIGWCSISLCGYWGRKAFEVFDFLIDADPQSASTAFLRIHTTTPATDHWFTQVGFDVYVNDVMVGSGISAARGSDIITEIPIVDPSVIQQGSNNIYIVYNEGRTGYGLISLSDQVEIELVF